MPFQFNTLLRAILAGGGVAAGGIPAPAMDIALTSSLDSRITFTRAGTRNYITGGVVTALATGTPAFESWDGINRGMAIEPGFTNSVIWSEDFTNASWTKDGTSAPAAGDTVTALAGKTMQVMAATATTAYHALSRVYGSVAAGTVQTFSIFVKPAAGTTVWGCYLRLAQEFGNDSSRAFFRFDGKNGYVGYVSEAGDVVTGATYGMRKLGDGVFQLWITGTWVNTGNKRFYVGVSANTAPDTRNYAGLVTDSVQVLGAQVATASGPTGYVVTNAATATQAVESASFNDTSWLTTTQGTFVIEHDCWSGPLVGSGANTVLGATVPGLTAIAWDGSTSDLVNNGGASTAGGLPTFSGSAISLLATSGATNTGHIKSIKFYNTRLTVAQLQTLTAPVVVSTAVPGSLRTVSVTNRLHQITNTTSGLLLEFSVRMPYDLGSSAASELRLDFPNIFFPGTSTGNAINITAVALERETGVVETVPVYVAGSRSFVVADGAATTVVSDSILPSSFTSLSNFAAGMRFWVRLKGSVSTAGHKIPGGLNPASMGGTSGIYNPAVTFPSAVDSTGALTFTGTSPSILSQVYSPILVGTFVSGDPKTLMIVGDSIASDQSSTWRLAAIAAQIPYLDFCLGGKSQLDLANHTEWRPYLKYARVLVDEMGTNNNNAMMHFFDYWATARTTYTYDKIVKVGLFPRASSTDSFATEANQTIVRAYPNAFPDRFSTEVLKYGQTNTNFDPQSVRGVNLAKWKVDGTANKYTADDTHPSTAGVALLAAEFQPVLTAISVT